MHRTYISSVESGKRNIALDNLIKIAESLEVTLLDLCNYEQPIHNTMLLTIMNEQFLLAMDINLNAKIKREIEIICSLAFDEEKSPFEDIYKQKYSGELSDASAFELANIFPDVINQELGINVQFKAIDFEVNINN